jgi:protein-disulfide isomerase
LILKEQLMKQLLSVLLVIFISLPVVAQTARGRATRKPQPQKAAEQNKPVEQANVPATAPQGTTDGKKEEDCGCDAKAPEEVADVNGVKVFITELDEPIKDQSQELQNQVIEARKRELDLQINSLLLESESKRRGITTIKLLQQEVMSKAKQPTEAEAQAFYDQNKERIERSFAEVKKDIIDYLHDQRQQQEAEKFAQKLRTAAQVKVLVKEVTPPKNEIERKRVFATVNGQAITSGDIEASLRPVVYESQERIYEMRKAALDTKINDILLAQEARKRNTTVEALIDTEIKSKVKLVSEEDARKFYDENKAQIQGSYEQVKYQILQYLQQQEQRKSESAFALELRKASKVEVFLREPEPPVYTIDITDQPTKGNAQARVTIVEFTDFECPSCAYTHPIIEELMKLYGDKVKLVVRDFPLNQHIHATKAAEAAEAAREQGKYWEYISLMFHNQKALEIENLKEYATKLGLDRKLFDEALDSGKYLERVRRDMADGQRVGVNSTPTVFINGRRIKDKSLENLKAAVEEALKTVAKK